MTFTSDHLRIDARSLALHRLIVEKLRADPALLDIARDNLRRWQASDETPSPARAEWAHKMPSATSGPDASYY